VLEIRLRTAGARAGDGSYGDGVGVRRLLGAVAVFAAAAVVLLCAALGAGAEPRASGSRLPQTRLYSPDSPFNARLPRQPAFSSGTSAMIAGLAQTAAEEGARIALRSYTVPLYMAGRHTPHRRVRMTASWRPRRAMVSVPIPVGAAPDPASDGHLAVIDRSNGCEYDFWRLRRNGRRWEASWGNALPVRGTGVFPRGYSARGSGFALLAGVVMPRELRRGRIDHALLLSYPYTRAGGPVRPATESDGPTRSRRAIPEGARLQLDPSLDLDALGLSGYERTIARALQVYGAYVGDTGGNGISLYALHPQSTAANPYGAVLPDETYPPLDAIPFDRMRVLRLRHRNGEPRLVPNRCARYAR
jgi:hypothetical protein